MNYEPIIGLEVHARLLTKSKLFSSDVNNFGGEPNTHISPVTLAHPGTLPFLNGKAIRQAVMLGLACESSIAPFLYFERKNYFYPDLPKGFQISQLKTPICSGGFVEIESDSGIRKIQLNRIHIEEDAGKSIHDIDKLDSLIDLNRAGTPLLEIVTEPVLFSAEEAFQFMAELRKLVRWLGICDGNMEEGSMRCDANISMRKKGESKLGTKVEVKNLNSFRFLRKAIEMEIKRQADELESGGRITRHTRSFDAEKGVTFAMRHKEEEDDYRYFPEPDLPPVVVTDDMLKEARENMPELPGILRKRFVVQYHLQPNEAAILSEEKEMAAYFERLANKTGDPRTAANWMLGTVKNYLNKQAVSMEEFPVSAERLADLLTMVKNGMVSHSVAALKIFPEMAQNQSESPDAIAQRLNLVQQSDVTLVTHYIEGALAQHPDKVKSYRNGKKGLLGFFMGEIMKQSKGRLNPEVAGKLLMEALNKKYEA
ncbi:MAG TPA: Asp-tRNA(Asn)/Glu-tRNA(Gln) amidotransferase subunit GatB [Chitinophagales bacterium]|nr:Asp-tRNA(Asn)/Glu-tRNA(Gln) amidotransferase subunit GatB [Chitinophagales bacterium]